MYRILVRHCQSCNSCRTHAHIGLEAVQAIASKRLALKPKLRVGPLTIQPVWPRFRHFNGEQ
jgi:hypothetical protein